jgi:hypothetical protein
MIQTGGRSSGQQAQAARKRSREVISDAFSWEPKRRGAWPAIPPKLPSM